jgi:hypothetical protein
MCYRFVFLSFSRSCERDRCRFEELGIERSFDLSRSCDDFRRLCFLLEGLRDRPIVLYYNTKSKQIKIK